jgi:hypothetical protein
VTLIQHECDLGVCAVATTADDLEENSEELEGIGCANDPIVIRVKARIEVKRTELTEAQ